MKSITILLLLVYEVAAFAQQEPLTNLYLNNRLYYNPATAGSIDLHNITTHFIHQWPKTGSYGPAYLASYDQPLKKLKSGIGMLYYNDQAGDVYNYNEVNLLYNYKIMLSEGLSLRIGPGISLLNTQIKYDKIVFAAPEAGFPTGTRDYWTFNVAIGAFMNYQDLNIGVSVRDVLNSSIKEGDHVLQQHEENWFFTADYTFRTDWNINFNPGVMYFRYHNFIEDQLFLTASFNYREWIYLGTTYRPTSALNQWVFHAGTQIAKKVDLQFTIDLENYFTGKSIEGLARYKW